MTIRKNPSPNKKRSPKHPSVPKQYLTFFLEIGTEELPSAFLPTALHDLEFSLAPEIFDIPGKETFDSPRLKADSLKTYGTPRRMALVVEGVQPKQDSRVDKVFGPPKSAAFDSAGKPTKAAEGFAKSQGVPVDQLKSEDTPKGQYVYAQKSQAGQPAKRVLEDAIPKLLAQLHFPKAMRWNASRVRFARPIRWIVAMLGKEVLSFEYAGLRSGQQTWGHRFPQKKTRNVAAGLKIPHASQYLNTLTKAGVMVDPKERRKCIEAQVGKLAKSAKAQIDPDTHKELIETAVYSVESPLAIMGSFHSDFLSIPKPVLISSMKEHQGFFSLIDQEGRLLPKFIAVTNLPWGDTKLMTKGNERVLTARLKDAQHFFREDAKRSLEERVADLHQIVFHQRLGTVYQKVVRVKGLVGWLADSLGRPELKSECERAAWLSKSDLTTGIVGEFPTLQGVMGEEYARQAHESPAVCQAIGSQYCPRFPDDRLPATLPGVLLALAERCDAIAAFFTVGMVPTGSEDPLGLRRAAYGVVRLVTEKHLRINMVPVFTQCVECLSAQGVPLKTANPVQESVAFIIDRLKFFAWQSKTLQLRTDVMEAVTRVRQADHCDVYDLLNRMQALQAMVHQSDFDLLMIGFKRAHRIVEKEQWTDMQVVPERFLHESEQQLSQTLVVAQQRVNDSVNDRNYGKALQSLLELKSPIDEFFGAVMVNDPDHQTRANRLSLLKAVDDLFLMVADFSRIQTTAG